MKIDYKNGSSYSNTTYKDEYIRAFLEDYITNEVCCECKYTGKDRVSDITLADFWGYISESFKYRKRNIIGYGKYKGWRRVFL